MNYICAISLKWTQAHTSTMSRWWYIYFVWPDITYLNVECAVKNLNPHDWNKVWHIVVFRAGTYEHELSRQRKVQWHSSFGSGPINLPSVKQHSTIDKNTEKVGNLYHGWGMVRNSEISLMNINIRFQRMRNRKQKYWMIILEYIMQYNNSIILNVIYTFQLMSTKDEKKYHRRLAYLKLYYK